MTIRLAAPEDIPSLMRMAERFHAMAPFAELIPFCPESMADTFVKLATHDSGVLFVAEVDGAVVGMIAGITFPHWVNAAHRSAQELFWWCDPEYRGKGAGMALADALEQWSKDIEADSLFMASTSNLTPDALGKLYQRRGFSKQDIYYAKGV